MTDQRNTTGAPPRHIHVEKKQANRMLWALLPLGLLALLLAFVFPRHRETKVASNPGTVVAATSTADHSTVLTNMSGLSRYLAGTDTAPRGFIFQTLKFNTGKSDIRAADAAEIDSIAATLKKYPAAHIRLAGYADARGSDVANTALGKARAESVKAALVAQGIDGARIETASGGTSDPVASNATARGQANNRRTELVVTSR